MVVDGYSVREHPLRISVPTITRLNLSTVQSCYHTRGPMSRHISQIVSRKIDRPSAECVQRDEHRCIVDGLLYWESAANAERNGVRVIRGDCQSDRAFSRDGLPSHS